MLSYEASSAGDPAEAWSLYAEPARWHAWAPQLRGASGLGEPQVVPGARGTVRAVGGLRVPARILAVDAPRVWTWRVGPVEFDHRVTARADGGCVVGIDLRAPRALEAVLAVSYGPVCKLLITNLARVAGQPKSAASTAP